jgi:hypothetical protein
MNRTPGYYWFQTAMAVGFLAAGVVGWAMGVDSLLGISHPWVIAFAVAIGVPVGLFLESIILQVKDRLFPKQPPRPERVDPPRFGPSHS